MTSNGNQPPIINPNCHAAIAGASCQQTPFTSQPFFPLPIRNFTHPVQLSLAPRTFSAPRPPPQPLLSITFPAPDFQQNITDNCQQSSQIATLKDGYESRISQLNQEVCHLRSSGHLLVSQNLALDQEKRGLEAQCAKLNDELLKKYSEMEKLNNLLESQNSTPRTFSAPLPSPQPLLSIIVPAPDSQQNISDNRQQSLQIATLKDGYESRIRQLNLTIQLLKSSEQQTLFKLEAECAKFNDVVAGKYSEMKALETGLESKITTLKDAYESRIRQLNLTIQLLKSSEQQTLFKLEAECAKFNDIVAGKNTELKDLEIRLESKLKKADDKNFELAQKLETAISTANNFQSELDNQTAELQNCKDRLKKADEEYYELSFQTNNLEDELDQKEKEMLRLQKLTDKTKLDTCQANLENALNDMSRIAEERDRLKMELKSANDNSETTMERIIKLDLKLKVEREKHITEIDKLRENFSEKTKTQLDTYRVDLEKSRDDISRVTDERDGLKVELQSASANSRELKAELEMSKKSIEELTIKLEKLKAESQRPSNLSVPLQGKVRKSPLNLPEPSSVMTAVKQDTIVLNDTIDLTIIDSDDTMSPSSSKKKRK